jgi:putative MATE family efflux protein
MDKLNKFQNESLSKLIVQYSLPATIGMIVSFSYNIIDRIFVGNQIGADALSGVAVLFPVSIMIFGLAFMVGIGANSNVSIQLGKKNIKEAELYLSNAFTLSIIIPIIFFVIIHIFFEQMLDLMGSFGSYRVYSEEFLFYISFGLISQFIAFGLNNLIRAVGFPNIAMFTQIIGALLNIILDAIFIFVFEWGVMGAAIATDIAFTVSMIWVILFFYSKKSPIRLSWAKMKPDFRIIKSILTIGFPALITQISGSIVILLLNHLLYKYGGSHSIAVLSIAMSIEAFMFVPIIGLSIGVRPIIGYNYGAQELKRVRKILEISSITAIVIGLLGFAIIQTFAPQLVKLFVPHDAELITMGVTALRTYTFFIYLIGLEIIATTYYQSIGNPKVSLVLSLVRQLAFLLPLAYILPNFFGLTGIWYSGALSEFFSSFLSITFIILAIRKLKKQENIVVPIESSIKNN